MARIHSPRTTYPTYFHAVAVISKSRGDSSFRPFRQLRGFWTEARNPTRSFCHFLAKPNVAFDLVVEVAHALSSMAHPVLQKSRRGGLEVHFFGKSARKSRGRKDNSAVQLLLFILAVILPIVLNVDVWRRLRRGPLGDTSTPWRKSIGYAGLATNSLAFAIPWGGFIYMYILLHRGRTVSADAMINGPLVVEVSVALAVLSLLFGAVAPNTFVSS
jgi:hypothetical protein